MKNSMEHYSILNKKTPLHAHWTWVSPEHFVSYGRRVSGSTNATTHQVPLEGDTCIVMTTFYPLPSVFLFGIEVPDFI